MILGGGLNFKIFFGILINTQNNQTASQKLPPNASTAVHSALCRRS